MPPLFIHDSTNKKLYRQQNRLLPILRIYPDLLEYIFLLGTNFELEDTIFRHGRQRAILSYSQTCHDWRVVALSIRPLWAALVDFEANSEAWNEELLRRSYPFPIVVGSTAYTFRDSRVIAAELLHLERIRIYHVDFDTSAWDILAERLQQPAPVIEYLDINFFNTTDSNSFILPSNLFANDAPRLKRLGMTQCLVDFQTPILRYLTTLSVEFLNPSNAPTPSEWLDHLTHLPLLTSLRLSNSMRSLRGPFTPTTTKQVELPLLSSLNMDASLRDTHIFLNGLNFPVSCGLIISCYDSHPGPDLDIVLMVYLHRLSYTHHLWPDNCPFIIDARKWRLFIWNASSDPSGSNLAPPTLFLSLMFDLETWETLLSPVLHILGEAFPNFTSLDLQLPTSYPGLLPCLFRATKLTRLDNVSATMTKNLFSEIQVMQFKLSRRHGGGITPLPMLHTIVFSDDKSMWGAPYQSFVSFLNWRRIVGYPITRLLFRECLVLDDRVEELESLGVQVDCDPKGSRWQRL